jgi:Effector protein
MRVRYETVKETKRGKELACKAEKSKTTYVIQPTANDAYYDPDDHSINIDPNFHPETQTTEGDQPAPTDVILGHEMGHAATGTLDAGPGSMNNVKQNENPIRLDLGLPARTAY